MDAIFYNIDIEYARPLLSFPACLCRGAGAHDGCGRGRRIHMCARMLAVWLHLAIIYTSDKRQATRIGCVCVRVHCFPVELYLVVSA